jgi:hypothetical protein
VIPRGSAERRRPVTGSAAWAKSTCINPSTMQKRSNARNPATKFCVALTETAVDAGAHRK